MLGLFGAQALAQHGQGLGASHADQAGQGPGAAGIRDQADLAEGLDEAGRAGRQHQVAGQRDVGTGAGSHAVHRADHRQRQVAQGAHQRVVELVDRFAQVRHLGARGDVAIGQVLAGAETTAFGSQQQHPCFAALAYLLECLAHFQVHGGIEAVQLLGAIQREEGDAVLDGKQDVLESHDRLAPSVEGKMFSGPGSGLGVFPGRHGCLRRGRRCRPAR
ncbi:hypothetical protein D3C72_567000 [compost metagenome]